ncbi:LCP family protein [Ktedonobacter racemifer]|uniref:Cell envelope-related transcriptional attenuator n=1 Tax=Ktedonobacter racemifer DSM 44963 TaxID=485913 RepID=D6THQ3_KTERA|nr:LCP family protein [Ktedonobacter racemifer]EFH89058.1 cell envelope-related transcriptional attenuator [Ktedonobacter racemifer DSM 44963]
MSDNNYYDDHTMPARPYPPGGSQNRPQPETPPGKLVLGNFNNANVPPRQQPNQPPQGRPHNPSHNAGPRYPQQGGPVPPTYTPRPGIYPPGAPPYSQAQNGEKLPGSAPRPAKRRRSGCAPGCLIVGILLIILLCTGAYTGQRVLAFGSAISTDKVALSTQTGYMNTGDRVNLLVMGYGGGAHDGANLTDSMVVISMTPSNQHTSLVSVPRDLWVQVPSNSGNYAKLNTVYQVGSNNGADRGAGGDTAATKLSSITGLDVKNWMLIDFNGFRDLINALGGIDVYVPDSFTSNYPKNDDPNVDASWITVHFNKGMQHMDGETAIRYARSRYVTDNPAEGTDFARSIRQQLIIKTALAKMKQISSWPSLFNAMDALQKAIYTNMSLADLGLFTMKMDLNNPQTARIGLSYDNVLTSSTSNDGQSILIPKGNNWDLIKQYVDSKLYK